MLIPKARTTFQESPPEARRRPWTFFDGAGAEVTLTVKVATFPLLLKRIGFLDEEPLVQLSRTRLIAFLLWVG